MIGIPFYLADPKLARLEKEMNDLEDSDEIMMYLRHEAGHAFNYAYRLYRTPEWRELFGPFRRPYRDDYHPVPFSRRFVRHIAGWYAQKHPDEDFAETFAVWLTPRSQWRKRYKGWGALAKLRYVDRMARRFRDIEPLRKRGQTDVTVEEMETTVEQFYEQALAAQNQPIDLPLDTDLVDIFKVLQAAEEGRAPGGRAPPGEPEDARRQGHVLDRRPAAARQAARRVDRGPSRGARPAHVGRRADGEPGRGQRVRHGARDELPDARKVRSAVTRQEGSA